MNSIELTEKISQADAKILFDFVDELPNLDDSKTTIAAKRAILLRADALISSGQAGVNYSHIIESAIEEVLKKPKKLSKAPSIELRTTAFEHPLKLKTHFTTSMNGITGVTSTPILITGLAKNLTSNKILAKITFYAQAEWQTKTMPFADIMNPTKIKKLADFGVHVNAQNAKEVAAYFDDLYCCNKDALEGELFEQISDQLGWTSNGFAGYSEKIHINDEAENHDLLTSIVKCGTLKSWVSSLKHEFENLQTSDDDANTVEIASPLRVICSAGLASILIEKLDLQPFIVHVFGTSGTGKSIALKTVCSMFGDPRPGKLFRTINGTINSLASLCASLHSIPLVADELETVRNRNGYDKVIMTLTEGIERARKHMNGRNMLQRTWSNTIVTSGESNIVNHTSMLGVHNRVIAIPSTTDRPVVHNFATVATATSLNFGHIGPKAVAYVEGNTDELRSICDGYRADIARVYGCTGKMAAMLAGILTADYVFCNVALNSEELFPDGDGLQPLEIEQVAPYVIPKASVELWATARDAIADYVMLNQKLFKCGDGITTKVGNKCIGSYDHSSGTIVIVKSTLEKVLAKKKIKFDDVKRDLALNNILIRPGRGRYHCYSSVGGCQGQFVTLHIPELVPDAKTA